MMPNNKELTKVPQKAVRVKNTIDLTAVFLKQLDRSPQTIRTYSVGLKRFLSWIEDRGDIQRLDKSTILDFRQFLQEDKNTALTINTYLAGVKSFFDWLEEEGIHKNIAKDVRSMGRPHGYLREEIGEDDLRSLFNKWEFNKMEDARDFALLQLLARCGLRSIEVVRSKIGDISQKGGRRILKIQGKGSDTKDKFVVLTDAAYLPIMAYLKATKRTLDDKDQSIFISHSDRNPGEGITTRTVSRIAANRLKAAGIKNKQRSTHSFRHSFASMAVRKGIGVFDLKNALRHADISNTLVYVHDQSVIDNPIWDSINWDEQEKQK